jgi:hypothetical protein
MLSSKKKVIRQTLFDFEAAIYEAVLKARDPRWETKVGKKAGSHYPIIKRKLWSIAIRWNEQSMNWAGSNLDVSDFDKPSESPMGPVQSSVPPQWRWACANNLELFAVEYITGTIPGLEHDADPMIMAAALRFIAEDPCKVPGALATAGFICPGCTDSWDVTQKIDIDKFNSEQRIEEGLSLEQLLSLSKIHLWPVNQKPEDLASLPLAATLFTEVFE